MTRSELPQPSYLGTFFEAGANCLLRAVALTPSLLGLSRVLFWMGFRLGEGLRQGYFHLQTICWEAQWVSSLLAVDSGASGRTKRETIVLPSPWPEVPYSKIAPPGAGGDGTQEVVLISVATLL